MDTVRLPSTGTVTLGRSASCAVRIDEDRSADEHEHAMLRFEDRIHLVDLGSGKPTKVANRSVPKGGEVVLSPGVVFTLGAVTCVVQRLDAVGTAATHDYFEARVEDECTRVAQTGGGTKRCSSPRRVRWT
jgi:hypothetical protein